MNTISTIVAATDFSYAGNAAAAYAVALAQQLHAKVLLVHAVNGGVMTSHELLRPGGTEEAHAEEDRALAELHEVARWIGGPEVPLRCLVVHGSARSAIPRVAEDERADLIVMGSHGRSGVAHLFLGSVAEAVLRAAPVPVLTVGRCRGLCAHPQPVAPAERA